MTQFRGSMVAMVTPFRDGQLDEDALVKLTHWHIEQGTHGVFRLRQYLARLAGGGCNPTPRIKVAEETVATAVIDGDDGLGHLVSCPCSG